MKSKYLSQLDELTVQTDERQQIDDIPWIEVRRIAAESYQMWDDKLNEIYGVLKQELPAGKMSMTKLSMTRDRCYELVNSYFK